MTPTKHRQRRKVRPGRAVKQTLEASKKLPSMFYKNKNKKMTDNISSQTGTKKKVNVGQIIKMVIVAVAIAGVIMYFPDILGGQKLTAAEELKQATMIEAVTTEVGALKTSISEKNKEITKLKAQLVADECALFKMEMLQVNIENGQLTNELSEKEEGSITQCTELEELKALTAPSETVTESND